MRSGRQQSISVATNKLQALLRRLFRDRTIRVTTEGIRFLLLTLAGPHLMPGWKAPIAAMITQSVLVIGLGFYVTYTSARR